MKQEINWRNQSKWIDEYKAQKGFTILNYIGHFLILGSTTTGCISVSAFASLVVSAINFKIFAITAGIKKFKPIIKKKKKKKYDKIVLLAKSNLNSIEVLISKILIDSVISHEKFVLIKISQKNITKWKKKLEG